jgi:hypothetical protein
VDEAIAYGATSRQAAGVGVDRPGWLLVFQRLKKGPLSKIPIMLITGSVSPESFAKHKGLKTHAEEYVEKSSTSKESLLAKIAAHVELGDPFEGEDDLDIPVEVDDINVGDGNVIDEEEPLETSGAHEYHSQRTAMGGPDKRIDSSVAEDVDDAFAGLMGGDDVPPFEAPAPPRRPTPIPEVVPMAPIEADAPVRDFEDLQRTRSGLSEPPPLGPEDSTQTGEPAEREEVSVVDSIPGIIEDGGRREDDDFDDFSKEAGQAPYPIDEVIASKDMISVDDLADQVEETPVPQVAAEVPRPSILESQPAIQLDVEDVEVMADGDVVIDEDDVDSGAIPEPVPHPRSAADAAEAAEAAVERSKPKSSPSIDLGLDKIADDADKEQQSGSYPRASSEERDQSGVYDRRALRKIGELERQVSQLKTELDRARVTAESAAKGGGREQTFLNLREKMMARTTSSRRCALI